jgi:uncharacterized protein YpmS
MKWYLWILVVILGLNILAVVMVGAFLLVDKLRKRRDIQDAKKEVSGGSGDE